MREIHVDNRYPGIIIIIFLREFHLSFTFVGHHKKLQLLFFRGEPNTIILAAWVDLVNENWLH